MKKRSLSLVILVVFLVSMILTGCAGAAKETGNPAAAAPQNTNSAEQAKAQTAKEESIADLFAKGKKLEGLSYDYAYTDKEASMNGKGWVQSNKFKMESTVEGKKMITIFDGDSFIGYDPAQNTAFKLSPDKAKQTKTPADIVSENESKGDKIKVLETVTYDGVKCRVISLTEADGKAQTKMWIREDYGIPIRVEVNETNGSKSVLEYKNVKVGALPADTFKLPAGVQVTDISQITGQVPKGTASPTSPNSQVPGVPNVQLPEGVKLPEGIQLPQGVQIPATPNPQ